MAKTTLRSDYQPYPFDIPSIDLYFDLDLDLTQVRTQFEVIPKTQTAADLVLNGEELDLVSIELDGTPLSDTDYSLTPHQLVIPNISKACTVTLINTCNPRQNTSLMGLYASQKQLFTQCEAEGFRRITWFADRPDVMSSYTVTLNADPKHFPTLLSNGNLIQETVLEDGRTSRVWHDPFKKPSYLFALVAGSFDCRQQQHTLGNGKQVLLEIYSDLGTYTQTEFAMAALQRAIQWDESRFNLYLDLDRFMIVATRDFNMGAMENKGLNVFNASYILADPATATDLNFSAIEAVIGHEYFHNWTGNRVTCRDWFQLSLKEGLTVFRDQEFTGDMMAAGLSPQAAMSAKSVKRIDDVETLKTAQFPEDKGPMAHPIRPNSYQEIGNFYTATVYEKGAEVIRMLHTLLGEDVFQEGIAEYFRRHDGQAVTCDDFVNAMEDRYLKHFPNNSLEHFRAWYAQAGTPELTVSSTYDAKTQCFELHISQTNPPVGIEPKNLVKPPLLIPIKLGLVIPDSEQAPVEELLLLDRPEQSWTFKNIKSQPIPSLLRDFSAPVVLNYPYTRDELLVLAKHDDNAFNRWDSTQRLVANTLSATLKNNANTVDEDLSDLWQHHLLDARIDAAYKARLVQLPSIRQVFETHCDHDINLTHAALEHLKQTLALDCETLWASQYQSIADAHQGIAYVFDAYHAGQRALKNTALQFLSLLPNEAYRELACTQYQHSNNMTDKFAALSSITLNSDSDLSSSYLADFYDTYQSYPTVIDKWFALQASNSKTNSDKIRALLEHPAFDLKNPNRARSVIFQFCLNNPLNFHATDGSGYQLWFEQVLALDAINPEIAARCARLFDRWNDYHQRDLMKSFLQQLQTKTLSRNVSEIIYKALENNHEA